MTDYALLVRYGEDEAPVRIELPGCSPDDAEVARQALVSQVEHAVAIEAPLIYSQATDADPQAGVPVEPAKVTGVDLVEALPD